MSSSLKEMREKPGEEQDLLAVFSDEEGSGKYLDLHEMYTRYLNLKGAEQIDYLTYLAIFDRLFDIPKERKNQDYRRYLEHLLEYLYDYISRGKPILNIEADINEILTDFDAKWEKGIH